MSSLRVTDSETFQFCGSTNSQSILRKCGRQSLSSAPGRKVHFKLFNDIKPMLIDYDQNNDDAEIYYNNLICDIRDSASEITDFDFIQLLKDAQSCINILNENFSLFVKVILILKWMNRSDEVVNEYHKFLLDVCTAYNCHTKFAIEQLVSCFSNEDSIQNCVNGVFNEEEKSGFTNIHTTLKALLKFIPLAKDLLMAALKNKFPYRKNTAESHLHYLHNLLHICKYEPSLRKNILSLIVNKLVEIDVHISKEELDRLGSCVNIEPEDIFPMEIDCGSIQINPSKVEAENLSRTLDICLKKIFEFMKTTCYDTEGFLIWDSTKSLYCDLLTIFENEILPIYYSSHIQYIIYYFLSFKQSLAEKFSNWLWKKCCDVSSSSTLRQAAAGYLASFLCRAPFISINVIKNILKSMSFWCNNYINEVDKSVNIVNEELLRWHAVFYSMCQALFYIISLRHQDLTNNTQNLRFMESLNLSHIVTCRLSPLRLCCSEVVDRFAFITKTYQLTYCYVVMDGHIRVTDQSIIDEWLYSFFPFGPYVLPRSKNMIMPELYREVSCINRSKRVEKILDITPSSPIEHMDISPSMVITPSPTNTDWLLQSICGNNKYKFV